MQKKDAFYQNQSHWLDAPMIHLLPHWNWKGKEGDKIPVYCYTNCEEAELFVNGKSMGRKVKGRDRTTIIVDFLRYEPKTFDSPYILSWEVPYQPGSIKVVGYNGGKVILEKEIRTAGKPARVSLSVDRSTISAQGKDLAYVTVHIEDKNGNFCPLADNLVKFSVSGAGEIVAVDNGNSTSLDSFQDSQRKAFNGLALVILGSEGEASNITLEAKSRGLKSDVISINVVE